MVLASGCNSIRRLRTPRMACNTKIQGGSSSATAVNSQFLSVGHYEPPWWASNLKLVPESKYQLGVLPTPIHRWHPPGEVSGVDMWIKRDDLSGMQMSGNKVRKLEFLLADAVAKGTDCVVTIGGIQSNHCRATAVAARYLGLDSHLILRTGASSVEQDPGLVGNLLVERMVGAHVHLVTKEEYARVGSVRLGEQLRAQLEAQGRHPYVIPVGGSNALGTWGYLQCIEEIRQQTQGMGITDIAMACGSGGTTAGLALGAHLAGLGVRVHAYAVCDDEAYFYNFVDQLVQDLGPSAEDLGGRTTRELFRAVQAKGVGYALSTQEELDTVKRIAVSTGVVLDPVYSGKAMHQMLGEMRTDPGAWRGRKVLFVHTGGLLGMYDKLDQLQPLVEGLGRNQRMQVAS